MKKLSAVLSIVLLLFSHAHAFAQAQLGPQQTWYNPSLSQPARPAPYSFTAIFDNLCGTTVGQIWVRSTGGWGCLSLGYANPVWWGASTATADNAPAFQSAAAASLNVLLPAGTYKIGTSVKMRQDLRFECQAGATITQGPGTNLLIFFDFFTNQSSGSWLKGCTLDGANATNVNTGAVMVVVGNPGAGADNVKVTDNIVKNCTNGGIAANSSKYVTFEHNHVFNCYGFGIAVVSANPGDKTYAGVRFNKIVGPSFHLIQVTQADNNDISNNILIGGDIIGDAATPMRINISGTAVTWQSGPDFTGATKGSILVANGGVEFILASVNSSTSITLTTSGGVLPNVVGALSSGDVLSLANTSFNNITHNFVSGGVTGGIVLANLGGSFPSLESSLNNVISDNIITSSGNFGIALEAFVNGGAVLNATIVTGNQIISPGRSGTAGSAGAAIQLSSTSAGLCVGVLIAGNYAYDYSSIAGNFWLTGSGAANCTYVQFGANLNQGFNAGTVMSGYPTYASLAPIRGAAASIIDGNTAFCGDGTCTTFGTVVGGGGGALKLGVWYNGTNWTLTGK